MKHIYRKFGRRWPKTGGKDKGYTFYKAKKRMAKMANSGRIKACDKESLKEILKLTDESMNDMEVKNAMLYL